MKERYGQKPKVRKYQTPWEMIPIVPELHSVVTGNSLVVLE